MTNPTCTCAFALEAARANSEQFRQQAQVKLQSSDQSCSCSFTNIARSLMEFTSASEEAITRFGHALLLFWFSFAALTTERMVHQAGLRSPSLRVQVIRLKRIHGNVSTSSP